jgi:hypothetical protein
MGNGLLGMDDLGGFTTATYPTLCFRKKDPWLNKLLVGSIDIDGGARTIGDYRLAHSPRSTSF